MEDAKCLYLMGVEDDDFAYDFDPLFVSDISLSNVTDDEDLNNGLEEIIELRIMNGGDHVMVHKSKFVCRVCMNAYQEGQVLIMTKCHCKYILIHEECEIEWSKNTGNCKCCDACKQEIRNIPVILSETMKEVPVANFPMICMLVSPTIFQDSRVEMEEEFLIVKVKTPQINVVGEQNEKIPKLEAICKICFDLLKENSVDVLIKTKCRCKFTLMHEKCAIEFSENKGNNICEVCEEDVQSIPVILSSPNISIESQENTGSSHRRMKKKKISRLFKPCGKA